MTIFDGLFLIFLGVMNLKHSHNLAIGLEIVVSTFDTAIFIVYEVKAFFGRTDSCHFTNICADNFRTTKCFQSLIFSHERMSEEMSESLLILFYT